MRSRLQFRTMKQHRMAVLGLPLALIGTVLMIALALVLTPGGETGIPRAEADGGDFRLDFVAAESTTYVHQGTEEGDETAPGSLQFDARAVGVNVSESLQPQDFRCGDRIIFFTEVTVRSGALLAQTIEINYEFQAQNNGQAAIGYEQVLDVGLSAIDFGGQNQESGATTPNLNASATLLTQAFIPGGLGVNPPPAGFGTANAQDLVFTVEVTGLEADEVVIVRIDTRLSCFGLNPTGTLQAALDSAIVTENGIGSISSGRQTIPMLGLGGFPTPTNTPVPPTNTPVPPTNTPVPPTNTAVNLVPATSTSAPPTSTPAPPTSTQAPPTSTPAPPTSTPAPPTSAPGTPTGTQAPPTSTQAPPTSTQAPPTSTQAPPTSTPAPPAATPTFVSEVLPTVEDTPTNTPEDTPTPIMTPMPPPGVLPPAGDGPVVAGGYLLGFALICLGAGLFTTIYGRALGRPS